MSKSSPTKEPNYLQSKFCIYNFPMINDCKAKFWRRERLSEPDSMMLQASEVMGGVQSSDVSLTKPKQKLKSAKIG